MQTNHDQREAGFIDLGSITEQTKGSPIGGNADQFGLRKDGNAGLTND